MNKLKKLVSFIGVVLIFAELSSCYAKCYSTYENIDHLLTEKLNSQNGGASVVIMQNG